MNLIMRAISWPIRALWRLTADKPAPGGERFMAYDPLAIDGDTVWSNGIKIRIWGIDAPEMAQPQGPASKQALARLCAKRNIMVEPMDRDIYGRIVGRLHYGRGDIGRQMVAGGWAISTCKDYAKDELFARKSGAGFWSRGPIEEPRSFRRRHTA